MKIGELLYWRKNGIWIYKQYKIQPENEATLMCEKGGADRSPCPFFQCFALSSQYSQVMPATSEVNGVPSFFL